MIKYAAECYLGSFEANYTSYTDAEKCVRTCAEKNSTFFEYDKSTTSCSCYNKQVDEAEIKRTLKEGTICGYFIASENDDE